MLRVRAWRPLAIAFAVAVVVALASVDTAAARWVSVGPPPGPASTSVDSLPDVLHDGTTLRVAWNDPSYVVQVATWNGASWDLMTSPGNGSGTTPTHPSLAYDGSSLYVAYNAAGHSIQFKRWDGSGWVDVGTPIDNSSISTVPHLLYAGGWFWLSYQDDSRVVHVLRGDGTGTWTSYATSPGTGSGSNTYSELAWDGTSLLITWNDGTTQQLRRWNGSAWDPLTSWSGSRNATPTVNVANGHMLAGRNSDDTMSAIWMEVAGDWISHGELGLGSSSWTYPSLAWSGSVLYGAYNGTDASVQVVRWEGPLPAHQLRQFRADGTTEIPQAQWTTDGITTNVLLRFSGTHKTSGAVLTPWVEIRPLGTTFSASCGSSVAGATFSGTVVTVTTADDLVSLEVPVTGLVDGTEYHWRACMVDGAGIPSDWVSRSPGFGVSTMPRWTLVPDTQRAATGVWGHDVSPGCARTNASTSEPLALDEDASVPSEAACTMSVSEDIVSTVTDATAGSDEYELTNAPADLQTLTSITVRTRLRKTNGKATSITASVHLSDGTAVGTATSHAATTTWTDFSYTVTGLTLTKAQVDGLFVRLGQSIGGGGAPTAAETSLINVDAVYSAASGSSVTVSGRALASESGTSWSQCDGGTANVAISADGAAPVTTSCSAADGAFSTVVPVSAADRMIAVFLDPAMAGDRGVTYTRNLDTSTGISGLTVVLGRTAIRSESGTAVTNAGIDVYDSSQDADIPASSDGAALSVAGTQLVVRSGATFTPGGPVTTPTIRVQGTYGAGSALLTLTGGGVGGCDTASPPAFCVEGTGTYTGGSATVRVTSSTSSHVRGDVTISALELVPTSGSPTFEPWGTQTYGSLTLGTGTAAARLATDRGPTITVTGTTTIASGATMSHTGAGPITLQGSVVVDGTLSGIGTGKITANGDVRGSGGVDLGGGTVELRPDGASVVLGSTAGTLDWRLQHLLVSNASASTGATVTLAAGGTGMLNVRGSLTLGTIGDSQPTTLQADTNDRVLDVDQDVSVTATGTLSASSSAAFRIGGSFIRNGSFVPNGGTVSFDDAAQVSTLSYLGSTTFAGLNVATASKELRFDETDRTTVTGAFTVDGAACGTPALLRSAVPGDAWELDAQGTAAVTHARIADSTAVTARGATSSFDGGGNTGWTIDDGSCAGSITLGVSSSTIALGLVTAGTDAVGSTTASVTTDDMDGYVLTATDESDTWSMECPTCPATIPDWTGTDATPTSWSAGTSGHAGITVRDAAGGRLAKWGTGTATTENDFTANRYAGLPSSTSVTLHTRATPITGDGIVLTYRLNPDAAQQAGNYASTLALTAIATP